MKKNKEKEPKERMAKDSELATLIAKRYMLVMFSTPTVFMVDGEPKTARSEVDSPEVKELYHLIDERIKQIEKEFNEVH